MQRNNIIKKSKGSEQGTETSIVQRKERRTFAVTQRGIKNDRDLQDFYSAALADMDAGRADIREMKVMHALTSQIIALESLKLRAGIRRNRFLLGK